MKPLESSANVLPPLQTELFSAPGAQCEALQARFHPCIHVFAGSVHAAVGTLIYQRMAEFMGSPKL
jgi:hypothetical protein